MEDPDRALLRRRNVLAVQPILRALRTSSLGNWMAAVARQEHARVYTEHLIGLWSALPPTQDLQTGGPDADMGQASGRPRHVALVVIGTERGLCGRFNATLVEYLERHLTDLSAQGCTVELVALGARVIRLLRYHKRPLHTAMGLSTSLPSLEMARVLTRNWLERYEQHALDEVKVLYCEHRTAGLYVPSIARLIPPLLPKAHAARQELWPPYEVETGIPSLHARMVEQWIALSFYGLLLKSAVAEHAARSQLMDSATQNAQRVLDELLQSIQLARQHATTNEMQELAAGAGLLKRRRVARVRRKEEQTEE